MINSNSTGKNKLKPYIKKNTNKFFSIKKDRYTSNNSPNTKYGRETHRPSLRIEKENRNNYDNLLQKEDYYNLTTKSIDHYKRNKDKLVEKNYNNYTNIIFEQKDDLKKNLFNNNINISENENFFNQKLKNEENEINEINELRNIINIKENEKKKLINNIKNEYIKSLALKNKKIEELEKKEKDNKIELNNKNNKIKKLNDELKDLKDKINKNNSKFNLKNDKIKEKLPKEINQLKNNNKNMKKEINDLKKINKDLNQKKLNNKNEELKNKIKEINNKNDELDNKNKELNNKNEELKINIKELNNKNEELNVKNKEINNEKKELDNKNKQLNNKIEELNNKIKEINNKNEELNNKNKELNNKNEELDNKIKELNNKNEELKINIKELNNKNKELNNKIKELNNNINNYINEIKKYENKNKNYEEIIQNYKLKEVEINKRNEEINKKEKEYENNFNLLKDKENIIEKEIKNIKIEKEKLKKDIEENNRIKKENKELEEEINEKKLDLDEILDDINNLNKIIEQTNQTYNIKEYPLNLYSNPTLIGLKNIEQENYINATLQCLSQTKPLTIYFLKQRFKNIIKNNNENTSEIQITPIYFELIKKLWRKFGAISFSPNTFLNTIKKMYQYKLIQFINFKDLIIFILDQLHMELKKPVSNNGNNINFHEPINQYNKDNAWNHFFSGFKRNCSIISDIFFGFTETTRECQNCKNFYNSQGLNNPINYSYGIFNCIFLPLEDIIKMKKDEFNYYNYNNYNNYNNNQIYFNNNILSIQECFYYNDKMNIVYNNNIYCDICKQKCQSIFITKIFSSPNILIIILNNKRNINKYNLIFYETIDISQFVLIKDNPQLKYNLYGVITYISQSNNFVASCKSPIDNKWYRYNDEQIFPILNNQKEVIEFGIPQVLFYQKIE